MSVLDRLDQKKMHSAHNFKNRERTIIWDDERSYRSLAQVQQAVMDLSAEEYDEIHVIRLINRRRP